MMQHCFTLHFYCCCPRFLTLYYLHVSPLYSFYLFVTSISLHFSLTVPFSASWFPYCTARFFSFRNVISQDKDPNQPSSSQIVQTLSGQDIGQLWIGCLQISRLSLVQPACTVEAGSHDTTHIHLVCPSSWGGHLSLTKAGYDSSTLLVQKTQWYHMFLTQHIPSDPLIFCNTLKLPSTHLLHWNLILWKIQFKYYLPYENITESPKWYQALIFL